MAGEVKAFFDILTTVTEKLVGSSNAYYLASAELKAFPDKVADLKLRQREWESLLQKHTLPNDHSVLDRLTRAKKTLVKEQEGFENFQKGNCCFRFCTKVTFPSDMIANLDGVVGAFDGILQGMRDEQAAADLLIAAANKRLAPFPFSMDDKYVPIMETVKDIKAALASDAPSGTMVLLHGESGRGKSTMAKYLALKFQEELKQGACTFLGGIYFLACEKSTNKFLLMEQLWKDLGFGSLGSYQLDPDMSTPDGHKQESEPMGLHKFEFDSLRRKVMAELELRNSQSMRMLIIVDNVWDRDVLNALRIPYKHVKYLVTSQKTFPDVTDTVRLAKPSLEEARQILRKHSGTWTEDTPLDPPVQIEVDGLIKQADFNTLVLANLGAYIKGIALDSYSKLEPEKLRELKERLYVLLNHMDEDTLEATAFLETYKQTIEASMTLVLDGLRPEAKIMVYLIVLCEDLTVDEIVLKVWFHRLYGKSVEGDIKYSSALTQLKTQSIILFESKEVLWRQEPWTRWSIHELRRQFIREKRKGDLEEIMEKLVKTHSEDSEDDDLAAVLCLLHGDPTCYRRALSTSGLEIHDRLRMDVPWSTRSGYHRFIKSFSALLHPTAKDESWQRKSHKSAEQIMLRAVKFLNLKDLDQIISQLLRIPETDLATCYALQSYSVKSSASPEVVTVLGEKIHKCLDVDINSNAWKKVNMHLQALGKFDHDQTLQIVPDLPETMLTLLQQSQDVEISSSVFLVLESLTWKLDKYPRRIASVPGLLETLVSFLDKDKHPYLFRRSIRLLFSLLCDREGIQDLQIIANFTDIPNALQYLIDLSPFSTGAACTLTHLVPTTCIAEKIASTPETLRSLLLLLSNDNIEVVRSAANMLQTLSESSGRKSICASPEALKRLVELVNEDTFMKCHNFPLPSGDSPLYRLVANVVILVTNCGKEFEAFLAAALGNYVALLADGVNVAVQLAAVRALEHLAFQPAICRTLLQTYPDLGNQLLRLMDQDAEVTSLNTLVDAFHTIVIKSAEFEDSWTDRVNEAIMKYVVLLDVVKMQGGAARAISKLAMKEKTCKLLDSSTVHKLVSLIREGTSSSTLKHVTYSLQSILIKNPDGVMSHTKQCMLFSGALKRYVALLDDGVEQDLKSESARALGVFASFTTRRNQIIAYPGALQKIARIIRIDGIPSAMSNVAYAVDSITVRGTNLEDPVGSFFSIVLEKYVSLLAVNVEQRLQEEAVRALGKLAFNEIARKHFCRFPDAVQRLVGLLKGSFGGKSEALGHLAVAINKFLLLGEELEATKRSAVLSEVVGRYIQLLGDEVEQAVQLQALKALATLCEKGDARRLVFTLPGAVDRIVGLLDLNVHANHALLFDFAVLAQALTVGGTNLTDKATVTFFLEVTERLIQLLGQVDGAEWSFTRSVLQALEQLASHPTFRRVILSHPELQFQLKKLLIHDGAPPSIFLEAAATVLHLNFRRPDWDERITAEFLSTALGGYNNQQSNADDVHTGRPSQQVAARVLDNLTSEATIFDQLTVSPMLVAWRLVRLLETNWDDISLRDTSAYLELISTHAKPGRVELRSEALNNYVRLLQKPHLSDFDRSNTCEAIADLLEPVSDPNQLASECPSITEQLLATFAWSEESSILEDIECRQSSYEKEKCTYETMRALTLINPATADQIVLSSSAAYNGRATAKISLKMHESALLDINRALELRPNSTVLLRSQLQVSDYSGASSDLHQAVNLDPGDGFNRCELGVLSRIMGNLDDALVHLDLAVDLSTPWNLFRPLRQRGYVKFLRGDEEGARADAEKAMLCKKVWYYIPVFIPQINLQNSPLTYIHFAT